MTSTERTALARSGHEPQECVSSGECLSQGFERFARPGLSLRGSQQPRDACGAVRVPRCARVEHGWYSQVDTLALQPLSYGRKRNALVPHGFELRIAAVV